MKTQYRILSIDAWSDGEGWSWNNWLTVGHLEVCPDPDQAIQTLIDEGVLDARALALAVAEDDGYNIVIIDRADGMPLYAIEYGACDD